MNGMLFCVWFLMVQPIRLQSDSFEFHTYEERLLEFFRRKTNTVRFCERQTIVFNVIASRALDPFDALNTTCYAADHIDPVDVLHACTGHRAPTFLRERIDAVCDIRSGSPGIDGFLA